MTQHEPTAWIEGNEPLVGWAVPKPVTRYIAHIHEMLRKLHAAYPDQQIELRIKEMEPNGWQCYINFTEHGVDLGASESFYINPPGV